MATGSKSNRDRAAKERAKQYALRTELHEKAIKRRVRDNILAGVVGGVVILGAVAAQVGYFVAGPGATHQVPSPAPSVDAPAQLPAPDATGAPAPVSPAPTSGQ